MYGTLWVHCSKHNLDYPVTIRGGSCPKCDNDLSRINSGTVSDRINALKTFVQKDNKPLEFAPGLSIGLQEEKKESKEKTP